MLTYKYGLFILNTKSVTHNCINLAISDANNRHKFDTTYTSFTEWHSNFKNEVEVLYIGLLKLIGSLNMKNSWLCIPTALLSLIASSAHSAEKIYSDPESGVQIETLENGFYII
jgi:hypothetical protein